MKTTLLLILGVLNVLASGLSRGQEVEREAPSGCPNKWASSQVLERTADKHPVSTATKSETALAGMSPKPLTEAGNLTFDLRKIKESVMRTYLVQEARREFVESATAAGYKALGRKANEFGKVFIPRPQLEALVGREVALFDYTVSTQTPYWRTTLGTVVSVSGFSFYKVTVSVPQAEGEPREIVLSSEYLNDLLVGPE